MSTNNTLRTTPSPPTNITLTPNTIMETTENVDIKPDVVNASTPAPPGSIIVLSDDDPSRHPTRLTSTSSEDRPLLPKRIAASKRVDAGRDEPHGQKRAASTEANGGVAKKAKANEESSTTGGGKNAVEAPKKEETIPELKERANKIIEKKNVVIDGLKGKLAETEAERDALEQSRDDINAEMIVFERKQAAKATDKKAKAAREKEWRANATAQIKADALANYEEKLKAKTASIEKQLNRKHAAAKRIIQDKLDAKTDKLDEMMERLHEAKDQWKSEVQDLKAQVKEQAKHGGAKAQQIVKEMKEDLKAKDKEIAQHVLEKQRLAGAIINLESQVSSESTQLKDMTAVYSAAVEEVKVVTAQHDKWKKRAAVQYHDNEFLKKKHAHELVSTRALHATQMREMDDKWKIQADNAEQSQGRVVDSQRAVWNLRQTVDKQSKQIGQIMDKNNELHQQKHASVAELSKKDEEITKLLGHLSRLDVSPLDVLKSSSSIPAQVPAVKSSMAEQSLMVTCQDFGSPFTDEGIAHQFPPPNPFQRAGAGFVPRNDAAANDTGTAGYMNRFESRQFGGSQDLALSQNPRQRRSIFTNAASPDAGPKDCKSAEHKPADESTEVVSDPSRQQDVASAGMVGASANQYSALMGGEPNVD